MYGFSSLLNALYYIFKYNKIISVKSYSVEIALGNLVKKKINLFTSQATKHPWSLIYH